MRYFLVVLLGLAILFPAYSQDTLVVIKPETARYYLETEDTMYVLQEKDSLNNLLISNLKEQVLTKDRIIRTYELDSGIYSEYIVTLEEHLTYTTLQLEESEGKLRQRKRLEILGLLGIIIAIIVL